MLLPRHKQLYCARLVLRRQRRVPPAVLKAPGSVAGSVQPLQQDAGGSAPEAEDDAQLDSQQRTASTARSSAAPQEADAGEAPEDEGAAASDADEEDVEPATVCTRPALVVDCPPRL